MLFNWIGMRPIVKIGGTFLAWINIFCPAEANGQVALREGKSAPVSSPVRPSRGSTNTSSFVVTNAEFKIEPAQGRVDDCPVLVQMGDEQQLDSAQRPTGDREGDATLLWLGSPFRLVSQTSKLALWEAPLTPGYRECTGKGTLARLDGRRVSKSRAYLFLEFREGWVRLRLDLTSQVPTARILEASVLPPGRPAWRWTVGLTHEGKPPITPVR